MWELIVIRMFSMCFPSGHSDASHGLIVSSSQSPTSAAILICAGPEILILSLDRQASVCFSLFAVSSDFSGTFERMSIPLEMRVSG